MATAIQTLVINCTSTAERNAFQTQLTQWGVENPGQLISVQVQSLKLTVTFLTLTVSPNP